MTFALEQDHQLRLHESFRLPYQTSPQNDPVRSNALSQVGFRLELIGDWRRALSHTPVGICTVPVQVAVRLVSPKKKWFWENKTSKIGKNRRWV